MNLVKEISKFHPDVWDMVELFRRGKGTDLPDWDDKCYVPIHATLAITSQKRLPFDFAALLAALAPWRVSKEVYRFDPDLEMMLYDQGADTNIPCAAFDTLPFQCVYIEAPNFAKDCHGFFVHFDHDVEKKHFEIRFIILSQGATLEGGWAPLVLHLNKKTVAESWEAYVEEGVENLTAHLGPEMGELYSLLKDTKQMEQVKQGMARELSRAMQLVLYLCAQNSEIKENPLRIPRDPKKIVDHGKDIRRWDVGLRIGRIIRASASSPSPRQGSGSAGGKRPHPRRGHWHHFWTGPRDDPRKRKVILKWVAPTFVGVPDDIDPVIVNKILGGR